MTMKNRLILVRASLEFKDQIVDMLKEWEEYNATHVTDHSPRAIFRDYQNFDDYIQRLEKEEKDPEQGLVPATTYFALDKERNIIVGACNIRHYLNDFLKRGGGHIGDGVRPSERRKGFGTEIIKLALEKCREMGIDRVLISCDKGNEGSRKTILNNVGVFEEEVTFEDGRILQKYWIELR